MSRRQAAAGCDGVVFIIPSDDACRAAAAVCTTRDKNLLVTVRRDLFVLFIYKRASSGDNVAASVKQPADSSSSPPQGTYINISSCISFSPFSISRKTNFRLSRTRPRRNGKWFKAKTHTHIIISIYLFWSDDGVWNVRLLSCRRQRGRRHVPMQYAKDSSSSSPSPIAPYMRPLLDSASSFWTSGRAHHHPGPADSRERQPI